MTHIELNELLAAAHAHSNAVLQAVQQQDLELANACEAQRFESLRELARWCEVHEMDEPLRAHVVKEMRELEILDTKLGALMQALAQRIREELQAINKKRKSSQAYAQVALR